MNAFIVYSSTTGVIAAAYTIANQDMATSMAAHTPAGMAAMEVESSNPVITNTSGWTVQTVNGTPTLTAVVQTAAQQLAAAKASQLSVLQQAFDAFRTANVSYMSTAFMADDDSQQVFAHALVAYTAAGATPSGFYVVDASYNKVSMTLAQLQGLIAAIAAQVWAAYQRWIAAREALAAATTVAQVQSITF